MVKLIYQKKKGVLEMSIHKLRKRFVKDQSLPIQVVQSPYFEYYLDLYDKDYNSKRLYHEFEKEVERVGGEDAFLAKYNKLKEEIIAHVSAKDSFKEFSNDKMEELNVKLNIPKVKLYSSLNDGKEFISIDLVKANFHTLKFYNRDIVDGKDTYEDWISQFTDSEYLKTSKYLRQVLFGNLNPKKQQKLQKFITNSFLESVYNYFDCDDVMSASHDEIVIKNSDGVNLDDFKREIETIHSMSFPVKVEKFELVAQEPSNELGFVKKFKDIDKVEFKGVPGLFMPQAFKKYYDKELQEEDLIFYHEGHLAKFISPIE